ncbi:DUF5675 family protein [Nitrosomonas sp.]|uniref:DUF5675 family protein n=1 Tax=Nitrosomonas sp. TaxID=42353 RepID=UPI001D6801F4|nr:DUF5675 family protein [Nitrosomonas sp.]MBX3616868.1 hypothetical protein [Nitrosomonas sp.]
MELTLKRRIFTDESTIGELLSEQGEHVCYVLEDRMREISGKPVSQWKVAGATAIPTGRYRIIWDMSNRFKKETLRLLNVPGYEGIRIHKGNRSKETEGCLLPETAVSEDLVSHSADALERIEKLICPCLAQEEVWITIANETV